MGNKMTQISRDEAVRLFLSDENVDVARIDARGETFIWMSELPLITIKQDDSEIYYVRFDYGVEL